MKFVVFLSVLIFCTVNVHEANAQKKRKFNSVTFKPLRFNKDGEVIQGFDNTFHIIYEDPCPIIEAPGSELKKLQIDWVGLLNASIKSLLFEHKNYPNGKTISRFSIDISGNYYMIGEKLLGIANKYVLPNRSILNQIYQWALPYYTSTFSALTIEEQQIQYNNLFVAEKYVQLVLENKDEKKFKQWLLENNLSEDEKIIGFIKRRLNKKQWTINDCKYWIEKFKNDFSYYLKNPNDIASHFQVIETLTNNLMIVSNHQGDYSLVNENYEILTDQNYKLILKKKDNVYAYRSNMENDYRVYSILYYKNIRKLNEFPYKHWNNYYALTDTSFLFTTTKYKGIYDNKNKKIIIDSCFSLRLNNATKSLIADREFYAKVDLDTSNHKPVYNESGIEITDRNNYYEFSSTGPYLFDFNGKQLSKEKVFLLGVSLINSYEDDSEKIQYINDYNYDIGLTSDNKLLYFKNTDQKVGVINLSGKTIVPFKYDDIDLTNYPKEIIALLNGEKEVFKMD
jgi:hypothetical protein